MSGVQNTFQDHFSDQAERYARYRPVYPAPFFRWLASLVERRDTAWDCATGNGQAAVGLGAFFERVMATDASEEQIRHAQLHERVRYRVAPAESCGLPDRSVDLVSVAAGIHWFDFDAFYREVRRVTRPRAVLAAYAYDLFQAGPDIDRIIAHFYTKVVGPYWPKQRAWVEERYRNLPFPFHELSVPECTIEHDWTLDRLIGYLGTWSSVRKCRDATGADPVETIRAELTHAWGPAPTRRLVWPLFMRVGRVDPNGKTR
jgi:ubiquinone/menaquinone biosynthesis C-methylase UbiE